MTKSTEGPRCAWCQRPITLGPGKGRPRQYCSASHRQRAFEARRRATGLALPAGHVVVAGGDLRRLHDRLYRLETALEDARADLADAGRNADYRAAYDHVVDAAHDLVGLVIEPARQ